MGQSPSKHHLELGLGSLRLATGAISLIAKIFQPIFKEKKSYWSLFFNLFSFFRFVFLKNACILGLDIGTRSLPEYQVAQVNEDTPPILVRFYFDSEMYPNNALNILIWGSYFWRVHITTVPDV